MDHVLIAVGRKVRLFRKQRGMTVQEIADRAGVSKGLVSKIENGRTIPSLPVLFSLIRSLETDIASFFDGISMALPPAYIHAKPSDFQPIEKEEAVGFHYFQVLNQSISSNAVEITILELEPGAKREKVSTDGHELVFPLKGDIVMHLDEEFITIEEGDAFFFDGRIPHVPTNPSTENIRFLVVYFLPAS